MRFFSSPSCMKCKFFQNWSPSALEMIKSFSPCHRAGFGVSPQAPGRIWGGRERWERSVTQAVWLLASQQRCLQLPEAIKTSTIIFWRSLCFQHLPAAWLISRLAQLMTLYYSMKFTGNSLSGVLAHTAAVGICSCPSSTLGLMKAVTD